MTNFSPWYFALLKKNKADFLGFDILSCMLSPGIIAVVSIVSFALVLNSRALRDPNKELAPTRIINKGATTL